jgi:aminopeptidase N
VTCDDFAQAIADANPGSALAQHLTQFKLWYAQAGTPQVHASGHFDAANGRYTLQLRQSCPPSPGQSHKLPFVIPVQVGLIDRRGHTLRDSTLLVLTDAEQSFVFDGLPNDAQPVASVLRGLSAPVILNQDADEADWLVLMAHDSDAFNRWEAAQQLCLHAALQAVRQPALQAPILSDALVNALRDVLRHPELDAAFKELVLTLPTEAYIAEQLDVVDPQRIHAVRETMRAELAHRLHDDWVWAYESHQHNGAYRPDARASGRRALSGLALAMLCLDAKRSGDVVWPGRTYQRCKDAHNMTDRFNALSALVHSQHPLAKDALQRFAHQFANEALVMDKWFLLQASAPDHGGDVLPVVRQLMAHPDFHIRNPNRARSLIFGFCNQNPGAFHRSDAAGYVFWSERVLEIDAFNPQVAARLARAMDRWRKLAEPWRTAAEEALKRVAAKADLSNDVREVVSRALAN